MTKNNTAGCISTSQPAWQYSKGQHVVAVWIKTSPDVRRHILAKHNTIGLMVANRQSKKWTTMHSPKIKAIIDVDNNSIEEILVATASNSGANIQTLKAKVSHIVSDFNEVIKLTYMQQKNFTISSKLKKDDTTNCDIPDGFGSTYIIRLPAAIPIVAEHGIKQVRISNSNCLNIMERYHPAVSVWAATIKFQMPGKNSFSKVKMTIPAYAPANNKSIPLASSVSVALNIITSDNEEDEPFLEALQICLYNLRANNKKEYYIANLDEDPNDILIKQQ
eukprot:15366129-Ditylum_brightwellii.AAC.1